MDKYEPSDEEVTKNGWNPKPGNLVPYYLQGDNAVEMYNDVQFPIKKDQPKSTAQSFKVTGLPS